MTLITILKLTFYNIATTIGGEVLKKVLMWIVPLCGIALFSIPILLCTKRKKSAEGIEIEEAGDNIFAEELYETNR